MHWILDSFSTKSPTVTNSDFIEPLIELHTDITMKNIFQTFDCDRAKFWVYIWKKVKYTYFQKRHSKLSSSFLTQIKTKIRNRLDQNLDSAMRCAFAKYVPRFELIIGKKQQQISH